MALLPGVNGFSDAATGLPTTVAGTRQHGFHDGVAGGFGSSGAGSGDKITTQNKGELFERTYFFRARRDGPGGGSLGRLFDKTNGTTGQYMYWWGSNNSLSYAFYGGSSTESSTRVGTTSQTATGVWFDFAVTHSYSGGVHTVTTYLNGSQATSSTRSSANTDAANTLFTVGNRADGQRVWDGLIACAYGWNRILSADDIASLSDNPYQLYEGEADSFVMDEAVQPQPLKLAGATNTQSSTSPGAAIRQSHAILGAPSSQASSSGVGGVVEQHVAVGAPSFQSSTSAGGPITQAHALAGAISSQASASPGAAMAQGHALAGAPASQASSSGTGGVGEEHIAAGAPSFQPSSSAGGAITQGHQLAGAASMQSSASPAGELVIPTPEGQPVGTPSSQASTSGVGAIAQTHVLAGAASTQRGTSPGAAAVQGHTLAGASSSQASTSEPGSAVEQHVAVGAPSFQPSSCTSGAIMQWHRPLGAGSTQSSTSPGGAIRQTIGGIPQEVVDVIVSPTLVTMSGFESKQFEVDVLVSGDASTAVVWKALLGKITTDGIYTAPRATGSEQRDRITAVPVADKSMAVTIEVIVRAGSFDSWGFPITSEPKLEKVIWPELDDPTEMQAEHGNYRKDRMRISGLRVVIENPRGSVRKWRASDGSSGSQYMTFAYGYIAGTLGNDGDELDCTIGPMPQLSEAAYVVNQFLGGEFDEHKIMLGFTSQAEAQAAYLSNYEYGWQGMESCTPCSMLQLKRWIENGDKSRPLTEDQLTNEGMTMEKVLWDGANKPLHASVEQVLYGLRSVDADDGLLYDSVAVADVLGDADMVLTFDALVIPYARIEQRMAIMRKVLDRTGKDVKVAAMQVSDPFTQRGTTNVAVIYELTDGQTVSVFFHNPDVTPKKITSADDLVSWKWMLNKRDITVAVAPERGRDLEPRMVAARIMQLAEKNSARFAAANGKRAERLQTIASLQTELDTKKATLAELEQQVQAEQDARDAAGLGEPESGLLSDEQNAELDRQIAALRARVDDMTNEEIYLVASILGIPKPYEKGHEQLMERIFANHPDDVADAIKRWEATRPVAAVIDVDGIKAVVTSSDPMPGVGVGTGWIVMNASRPLLGTETMSNGDFLDGRFYAAIDPTDSMAQAYVDENVKNSASVVFRASHEELNAMALNTVSADSVGAYLEMDEEERDIALRGFVLRLNGRAYGELKALAAKGMPTAAAAAPEVAPEPEAAPAAPAADEFALTSESAEEARARIAQEEAAAAEAKAAEVAAARAEREAQEQKEIASRQAASADNFELGQDPIDALSGQKSLLDVPAAPAAERPDLSYRADDMFTSFLANTPAGEDAWKIIAADTEGTGKVLNQHAASVIAQLRAKGYTVAKETGASDISDDELLAELTAAPAPAPEPAAQPDPRAEATAYLQSVIDGTANLSDPAVSGKLGAIHAAHKDDADMLALFKQAVKAYSAFAVAKANAALAK